MRRITRIAAAVLLACAACASGPLARHAVSEHLTPPRAGLQLLWRDEFDGATLDTTKWTVHAGTRREAQNTPDAVTVASGLLTITTYTQDAKHNTGFINTANRFLTTYGWFEARIRFASSPGEWGAFWLQSPTMGRPVDDVAVAGAEIDIAEHRVRDGAGTDLSNLYGINLHWNGYGTEHQHAGGTGRPPVDAVPLQNGWHTYAVHWTAEGYTFFLDGVEQWRTASGVSRRPEFVMLTCEVQDNASWAGHIPVGGYGSPQTSATKMDVDWVRVWRDAPAA